MMNNELRVAYLGNQIAYGGAAKSLLLLIKTLRTYRLRLYLFVTNCSSREMKAEFEDYVELIEVISLPEIVSAQTQSAHDNIAPIKMKHNDKYHVIQFIKRLNELSVDVLHINNSVFAPVYKLIKTHTKVKIVSHVRELIHWNGVHDKQKYIIENISKYSDAIICISDNEAEVFQKLTKPYILPNPFDFEQIYQYHLDSSENKKSLGISDNTTVVGMMGGIRESKGVPQFISAVSYLHSNSLADNMTFMVLGGEPKKPYTINYVLRKIFKRNTLPYDIYTSCIRKGIFDKILFLKNRKNVFEIVNTFDIAVRPSISGDPWGRDIIEYMALRKPVVATGTSEFYVENEKTGYLVPPKDTKKLAENIVELARDPVKRNAMGIAGYDKVKKMCDIQNHGSSIYNIYQTVCNKKNNVR